MYTKLRRKFKSCPNCDYLLNSEENYCPQCGQENHHLNVPFHHLVGEFIETIFHIDTKVWATLKAIFVPGKLTTEFIKGKRASYMPPARFYIMISFFFIVILNYGLNKVISKDQPSNFYVSFTTQKVGISSGNSDSTNIFKEKLQRKDIRVAPVTRGKIIQLLNRSNIDTTESNIDSMRTILTHLIIEKFSLKTESDSIIYFTYSQLLDLKNSQDFDSLLNTYIKEIPVKAIDKKILSDLVRHNETNYRNFTVNSNNFDTFAYLTKEELKTFKYMDKPQLDSILSSYNIKPDFLTRSYVRKYYELLEFDASRDFSRILYLFTKYFSYLMFLLMPFVALILLIINYRWKRYFYEYLIFSVHLHATFFFFSVIEVLLRIIFDFGNVLPIYSALLTNIYLLISLKRIYHQTWKKTFIKFSILSFIYSIVFLVALILIFVYSSLNF